MNIVERGRHFLQSLHDVAGRSAWDWRRCPICGETLTQKWGVYRRHPWLLSGRQTVVVQRHFCTLCRKSYSEQSPTLVRGSWYAREIRRCALDQWQHGGSSVRKTAELLRSLLGRQERWLLWRPLDPVPPTELTCRLSASSVERWLDAAGAQAKLTVVEQLATIPSSGQLATDGLWARLKGRTRRVVLLLADSASGLIWPPVVVGGEETPAAWKGLFDRAAQAGLDLRQIRGVTSDGAVGLLAYLARHLDWVSHQRCVFHLWRPLIQEILVRSNQAARGLAEAAAKDARRTTWRESVRLVRAVFNATSHLAAQHAFDDLAASDGGKDLSRLLDEHLDAALVHLLEYNQGLVRTSPEWLWRDFRSRLSHGRNHGSDVRLERAALLFAISHNFEPAQDRSERHRSYRHPGRCPLAVAGVPPNGISYLDALSV
jgi:transposase-like protein